MSALLGIDLGTTYSAMATLDERGRPITVPNRDGDILTPSVVYLTGNTAVVGQAALDIVRESPADVALLIKRRMGYPTFGRAIRGRDFRPETLSAVILKKLLIDASARLGPIGRAVITVPAYFDDTRRKATRDAGRIAGLDAVDVFDEPSAAALASSLADPDAVVRNETVLVYDLGGGTFDVSIVRVAKKRFQTLAIEGDVHLGGHDWDTRIVDHLAGLFVKQHGSDPREDAVSLAQLQSAAERAKRTLSKLPQTTVNITHAGKQATVPLTRIEFEKLTRDLLVRTKLTVQQALKRAGLGWDGIDRVLPVGGSTHMPMTRELLRHLSGREPDSNPAVSELVARGAALHAGVLAARRAPAAGQSFDDVVEVHVTAHALGVEVRDQSERINDPLVAKNTQLPAEATRVYHTVKAGQRRVRVLVLQGEARQAEACIPVGECWVEDLAPGLPARTPVEVTCGCGADGIVTVTARQGDRVARTILRRAGGLSDAEIERERDWVAGLEVL